MLEPPAIIPPVPNLPPGPHVRVQGCKEQRPSFAAITTCLQQIAAARPEGVAYE